MKVLVIDDDDMIRTMMVQALKSAGYETEESADGTDAIAKLQCNQYDIVVTDVVMPNQSGISVGAHIRENKLSVSVLAISAHSNPETGDMLDFANYFADDTLQKPFDKETFLKAVKNLSSGTDIESALQNI